MLLIERNDAGALAKTATKLEGNLPHAPLKMVTEDDGVLCRLGSMRRTGQSRTGSEPLYAMRLCVV
jgi:hypothetical protein